MKRSHTHQKNTEKMIKLFRKIAIHVVLLCLMLTIETAMILKMGITPVTIQKISLLLFMITALIPAGILQGENDFYETVEYYFGILLIWTTIGVGFFDSEIKNVKQLTICILISFSIQLVLQMVYNKKVSPKFKNR